MYLEILKNSLLLFHTTITGKIIYANNNFLELTKYDKEELINSSFEILTTKEISNLLFEELNLTIFNKKPIVKKIKIISKNDKIIFLDINISFYPKENIFIFNCKNDTEIFLLNNKLEISENNLNKKVLGLKKLNTNLKKKIDKEIKKNDEKQKLLFWQSRMASLGQMIGNIAHQWRQPLTELNLNLFNIYKSHKNSDEQKLERIYKDSKKIVKNMSNTIDDFSNFFNPNKQKITFGIRSAVSEALSILRKTIEKENINIIVNIEKDYTVVGIPNELTQVVINLLYNSKDAFKQNEVQDKKISIELTEKKVNNKFFTILNFIDNAKGVPNEIQDKIFEPYFTTKHKLAGTGLGLFMSKMIIEKGLEGTIMHKNTKNGSQFIMSFPLYKEEI